MIFLKGRDILEHGIPPIDYHLHSTFSDGKAPAEEYVVEAKKQNLNQIAFTEHVWRTSSWIPHYIERLNILKKNYDFEILAGVEAKAINLMGEIDFDFRWNSQIDLIMGVIHRLPKEDSSHFHNPAELKPKKAAEIETVTAINMIKRKKVHVLGHPTLQYYRQFGYKKPFPIEYIEEIMSVASKYNVPLEIVGSWSKDIRLIEEAFHAGVLISFGSGGHSPNEVGYINKELIFKALKNIYLD